MAVLNALRPSGTRLTQAGFFSDWPAEWRVTFSGMTLQQLGELLRRRGAEVEIVFEDRFLILDVAAYRYPPTWVSAADFWNAMNTVDSTSGKTRGFAVIRGH